MGRQINFFLHPDDQQQFDEFLKSFGDSIILPYYHYDNKISTIETTVVGDSKKEGRRVYLIRKEDLKKIKLEHITKFNYWLVKDLELPVLHFDRSIWTENKISSGRLYFEPEFVQDMKWIKKDASFVNWADKIVKAARRKLKTHKCQLGAYNYSAYFGDNALNWFKNNNADIVAGGHELVPSHTLEK